MRFHPTAWLLWWCAAVTAALITRNPLYLVLVLLTALWVRTAILEQKTDPLGWVVRWGWIFVLIAALFNGLTIHYGETILTWLPHTWPLIGGRVTLEAITFGAVTGLSLVTLLVVFAAFNAGAEYSTLLRLVPGFLFHAGLVISIALAFVPQTIRAFQEVREAQMIRGHRFQGWRDLPPLLLPLLISGLERSVQLAEAMESRGFGGRGEQVGLGARVALLVSLGTVLLGFGLDRLWQHPLIGVALIVLGGAGLFLMLRRLGARVTRTRYRQYAWTGADRMLAGASLFVVVFLWGANVLTPAHLVFYPYPRLTVPEFNLWIGIVLLLLVTPALLGPSWRQESRSERRHNRAPTGERRSPVRAPSEFD